MKESISNNVNYRPSSMDLNGEPEEKNERDQKSCCGKCCHYLFCCCCCEKHEKTKSSYRKGWRKYLKKEGSDSSDKSFQILTNLFANAENSVESLQNIRLNPNLVSENKLRNDLEFYIPQLCTFLLFGEVKAIEEFFVFLCKVCNASFFFAHRVHWFLSAMINNAQEKKEDIKSILKMINTLFRSENKNKRNKLEKFYITNSEAYINYIKNNELYFLYDNKNVEDNKNIFDIVDFNSLNMIQQLTYNKYKKSREIIIKFSNDEYKTVKDKQIQKLKDSGKFKNINPNIINDKELEKEDENNIINTNEKIEDKQFMPNDFFIDLSSFKLNNKDVVFEDEDDLFEIDDDDEGSKKQNFLYNNDKNDDFVNLEKTPKDINFISYHSTLNFIDHLCDISNDLPKYPIDEQMLFLYKQLNEINKKLPCNVYLPFLKDSTRNYIICHIPLDGVKIFRTKTRCPIMLTFEMVRIDEINKEIQKEDDKDIENTGSKSISSLTFGLTLNKNFEKNNNKLLNDIITSDESNDYDNADYDLSKPLLINKEIQNSSKKDNNTKNNNEEEEKVVKLVNKYKNRNTILYRDFNQSKTVFEGKRQFLSGKKLPISSNNNNNKDNKDDLIKKINNMDLIDNKIIEEEEEEEKKPMNKTTNNYHDFSNIFGEKFEEKEKNLKKTSLFGKFKSHKIFRCIFKTHEDLRQEQFATQLINEFNQIFKLENVNCWLNTYEIISTGNDSGLVEMVNDSLSLDQLKQKLNNISLHDFYLYYWGKGHTTSQEYKKAMNNYVSSLAGYSLICYFLQIKDRHNGNILIDNEGHIIHIDFGFLLSNAPGKGLKFENAPFKLSKDMVEVLGGVKGKYFMEFRKLLKKGFLAVHKHRSKIVILVEMMWCGHGKNLGCFEGGQETIDELKNRLNPKDYVSKRSVMKLVDKLIGQSVDNWRTKWYDIFQYYVQGIFY